MSARGTGLPFRNVRALVAIGGKAEKLDSCRVLPPVIAHDRDADTGPVREAYRGNVPASRSSKQPHL
jgi:hypothetical protein